MTTYAFSPRPCPTVAIHNSAELFPVRRIFCVGKNYAEHVREMGGDPKTEPPFFFSKPADALVGDGAHIPYPKMTGNLHHEAELVVAIGTGGSDIAKEEALDHIWGYAAGNDLTRRDLQALAKKAGRPWDMAKGFDNSAVCGALSPVAICGHLRRAPITATVDGETRQSGDIADMTWSVPEIIASLSRFVTLEAGDLIFTGTPEGVGPLVSGQTCTVMVKGLAPVTINIG